jgi:hypothetical protein
MTARALAALDSLAALVDGGLTLDTADRRGAVALRTTITLGGDVVTRVREDVFEDAEKADRLTKAHHAYLAERLESLGALRTLLHRAHTASLIAAGIFGGTSLLFGLLEAGGLSRLDPETLAALAVPVTGACLALLFRTLLRRALSAYIRGHMSW